jgi:uncharacterized protein YcfJ
MKRNWMLGALGLCALGNVLAQDVGRVLSSTPLVQQVAVPRRVCSSEQVSVQQPNSGVGSIIGAIAGGALGNSVGGHGAERAAATVIGTIGGAVIGDRVEGPGGERSQIVERCRIQNFTETRNVGYQVVYEFGGKQYSVQMPQDPGPTIALQVSPAGATQSSQLPYVTIAASPSPVYTQESYMGAPPAVYYPVPVYRPTVVVPWGYGHRDRYFWR